VHEHMNDELLLLQHNKFVWTDDKKNKRPTY